MKTIRLSRAVHNGVSSIFFTIGYDEEFNRMIRTYPGRLWSNSVKSWYIPDEEDSFRKIVNHFRGKFRIDATALHEGTESPGDSDRSAMLLPSGKETREVIRGSGWGPVSMTVDHSSGKLIIKFMGRYDQEWIKELRQYGKPYYNPDNKEWVLPATRAAIDSLSDYFSHRGVKIIISKPRKSDSTIILRNRTNSEVRSRDLGPEATSAIKLLGAHLREMRYSRHTINSYTSHLGFFFRYFNDKAPSEIDTGDIASYMDNFVISLGYSASYQNQAITAIKTYYILAGMSNIQIDNLKRPRSGRPLPQVFSREEITSILNATRNLKHRLLLWMIYSCGLRRSEVVNIRLEDLNRGRGILHIKDGKGGVDRVVPVSERVWVKLDEYMEAYRPVKWLFEGQGGDRYSVGSVYNVFKQALRRVGIKKDVGVHSLRHSYATHLHESGLDIRYIQELLGHRSSRTTEIYTHVSRRTLINIKSPIDDLDLK